MTPDLILRQVFEELEAAIRAQVSDNESRDYLVATLWVSRERIQPCLALPEAFQKALEAERRSLAEEALESWDFGVEVEGFSGWTIEGDRWENTVYLEGGDGQPSSRGLFALTFEPGMAQISALDAPERAAPAEDVALSF